MEEIEPTQKPWVKIKPELLIALIAVFISFLTLFVYLYQSNLMKTQQKMSVWPHLTFGPTWGTDFMIINLLNKGIGPAIIQDVRIAINDEPVEGIQEIMRFFPDSLKSDFSYSSLWAGQVVMAGESIQIFKNSNPATINYLLKLIEEDQVAIEICYCSVYEDCWKTTGFVVIPSKCK